MRLPQELEKGLIADLRRVPSFSDGYVLRRLIEEALPKNPRSDDLVAGLKLSGSPQDNAREVVRRCQGVRIDEYDALYHVLGSVQGLGIPDDILDTVTEARRSLGSSDVSSTSRQGGRDDTRERQLTARLEILYEQKFFNESIDRPTGQIVEEIIGLKRELRAGPELIEGDILAHRYKLAKRLGSGGFATVWKAWDRTRREHVAVKVLHGQHSRDASRVERFFRGARVMATLHHSNIVQVLESKVEDGGHRLFVMEFMEGGDLRGRLRSQQLSSRAFLGLMVSVGEGVAYCHERSIIHRDLKPANILLSLKGSPKISDFDLVRAADTTGGTGMGAMGTIVYSAPECMVDASQADDRADIYSLTMICVVGLLGGREPKLPDAYNPETLVSKLPVAYPFQAFLAQGISVEPSGRPAEIAQWISELKKLLTAFADPAYGPESSPEKVSEPRLKREDARWKSRLDEDVVIREPRPPRQGIVWRLRAFFALAVVCVSLLLVLGSLWSLVLQPLPLSDMVAVPGGEFFMGCNEEVDKECRDNEKPGKRVSVEAFFIDRTEVTVEAYAACVAAGECSDYHLTGFGDKSFTKSKHCNWGKGGRDKHPINCIDWSQASEFCAWLGKRLLTEIEWEKAARGTDGRKYPWGNQTISCRYAVINDRGTMDTAGDGCGRDSTWSVGSKPEGRSPYGALDMVGNVWEWTDSWRDESEQKIRAFRGGSWSSRPARARASERVWLTPGLRSINIGFRCARAAD